MAATRQPIRRLMLTIAAVTVVVGLLRDGDPGSLQAARPEGRPSGHANVPLFTTSDNCMACHNNLSASGENVSIGVTWRSTMMANAARDPYFHAAVRREVSDHRSAAEEIQDECAACHMPMLRRTSEARGRRTGLLAHLPGTASSEDHRLAADGVSCTVCHQISNENLGQRASFNGAFVLRPTPSNGARQIFGPYSVDAGRTRIMRSASGFVQTEAAHIKQSELCATCHTLYTDALGEDGTVIGSLPEQMNFQEWWHSAYRAEERSCQSCHMPQVQGPVRIASVLGDQRDGLSRHLFVGGNFLMLDVFRRFRSALAVMAEPSELEATMNATRAQLRNATATIAVEEVHLDGERLTFVVNVRNLAGHKVPTGYPSRRAWLHVTVTDEESRVVFDSGAVDPSGLIRGNIADLDPLSFEPHYDEIDRPDQVQIYESVMGDANGRPTTGLLQAVRYLKDNRLLPRGFVKSTADPDVAVHGDAEKDHDFDDGGDRVRYVVERPRATAALTIDVELRYQPIGFRWASNLEPYDTRETNRFASYFKAVAPMSSTVLDHVTATASAVR